MEGHRQETLGLFGENEPRYLTAEEVKAWQDAEDEKALEKNQDDSWNYLKYGLGAIVLIVGWTQVFALLQIALFLISLFFCVFLLGCIFWWFPHVIHARNFREFRHHVIIWFGFILVGGGLSWALYEQANTGPRYMPTIRKWQERDPGADDQIEP